MKKHLLILPSLGLMALAATPNLHAQAATEKTTETTVAPGITEEKTRTAVLPDPSLNKREGKIDRMDPETNELMLRTKLGDAPIAFTVNRATKFIDLDGKPVDTSLLKPELPIELSYAEDGNKLIATNVVVQRVQVPLPGGGVTLTNRETLKPGGKVIEQTSRTTATFTTGALQSLDEKLMTVRVEGQKEPVRYQITESTRWVNAAGEALPATVVKAGYPVKVSYTRQGDIMVADQVIVTTREASAGTDPLPPAASNPPAAPVLPAPER